MANRAKVTVDTSNRSLFRLYR